MHHTLTNQRLTTAQKGYIQVSERIWHNLLGLLGNIGLQCIAWLISLRWIKATDLDIRSGKMSIKCNKLCTLRVWGSGFFLKKHIQLSSVRVSNVSIHSVSAASLPVQVSTNFSVIHPRWRKEICIVRWTMGQIVFTIEDISFQGNLLTLGNDCLLSALRLRFLFRNRSATQHCSSAESCIYSTANIQRKTRTEYRLPSCWSPDFSHFHWG